MTFRQLPIGEYFRFFVGGSILRKTSERSYEARQWGHHDLQCHDLDQPVIHVEIT